MEQLQVAEEKNKTLELESNFTETEQELLALLGTKRKSGLNKFFSLAAFVILLIILLVFWRYYSNRHSSGEALTYRKYTVQRGDVIFGSSESSSISLSRETVKFPVSTTVEKVFIKAGQSVKKGDPLMQLNIDQIKAGLITYQLQVKMAELKIEQAKLEQQTKLLKAEQTYKSAILQGQLSENSHNVTITQLEMQLSDVNKELEDALEDLNTYQNYEDNYDGDYSDLQALSRRVATYKSLYQDYYSRYQEVAKWETDLATWQELYNNLSDQEKADTEEDSKAKQYLEKIAMLQGQIGEDTSAALYKSYQNAYEDYQSANSKYSERLSDFNQEYDIEYGDNDALADKIENLREQVENYNIALENAKLSQKTGTLSAEQTKQLTDLAAQTAQAQYNLTILQLSQAVDEAQENYDQTVRQINDIQKSISDEGIVYAPCTGMIVSVALKEGDDFDVIYDEDTDTLNEETLLTMTDISFVYVPITISEEDILDVYIGQSARVTMAAFEDVIFDAEVDTISVEAARSGAATVRYTVSVKYIGENIRDMYEGMSAQTTLIQRIEKDVLYVNNQAVTNKDGIATVQKMGNDGNLITVTVKTGFSNGQNVEIVSGLEEGDTVLAASGVREHENSRDIALGVD